MTMPNPWYTENNPSEFYQVPRQNSFQNLQSELNPSQTSLLMELKQRGQIIGKLIKHLDEEKKMRITKRNEKRSDCTSDTNPTFRRIQDILH